MALRWEAFDVDPAANNSAPPIGAPENGVRVKEINNILRNMMAAIFEIGDQAKDLIANLGTMSTQDNTAVNIDGGTLDSVGVTNCIIGASNNISASGLTSGIIPDERYDPDGVPNSLKFNGLGMQQVYNFFFPIGFVMWRTNEVASVTLPPGVTATWSRIALDRYPRILSAGSFTGTSSTFQTGGRTTATTDGAGGHSHGGATQNKTLTVENLPEHDHAEVGLLTTGNGIGYRDLATNQNSGMTRTGKTGGNIPHNHDINPVSDHTHDVTLDPAFVAFAAWRRTA